MEFWMKRDGVHSTALFFFFRGEGTSLRVCFELTFQGNVKKNCKTSSEEKKTLRAERSEADENGKNTKKQSRKTSNNLRRSHLFLSKKK